MKIGPTQFKFKNETIKIKVVVMFVIYLKMMRIAGVNRQ